MTMRRTVVAGLALVASVASPPAIHAAGCAITQCDPALYCRSTSLTACFEQTCPETTWLACVRDTGKKGLWVGPVYLKRTPAESWMSVLYEAGLTEILVPYHLGNQDQHLRDMQYCVHCLDEVSSDDAGRDGFLATLSGDTVPRLVVEARDRGVAWMCKSSKGSMTRRGEEMVIWGVYDTGNYDYMIRYGFQDDGVITFRLGATGWNNNTAGFPSPSGTLSDVAHMHTALWRVDIDLNGSAPNTVSTIAHREPDPPGSLRATDTVLPFNGGQEGFMDWDPLAFNSLLVENSNTLNAHAHPVGYELVPLRTGSARHYGSGESFSQHDFWATIYHRNEAGDEAPYDWLSRGIPPDEYLEPNANNHEPVVGNDVILWYLSSAHHDPHDEDHAPSDTTPVMKGLTLTHWVGFDLVPHNLFDYNPLGGPHRDQCDGDP